MNVLRRAITCLKRQAIYRVLLCLIIFLVIVLSITGLSVTRIVNSTEENFWANLPGVVVIEEDQHANELYFMRYNIWPAPFISHELIQEISTTPHVDRYYTFLRHSVRSRTLERFWDLDGVEDTQSLRNSGINYIELVTTIGVTTPEFAELNLGIMDLTTGSSFTLQDIEQGRQVALISQEFAAVNDLDVGSMFLLENLIPDLTYGQNRYKEEHILAGMSVQFEVIGLFDLRTTMTEFQSAGGTGGGEEKVQRLNLLNTIYIPYAVSRRFLDFSYEAIWEIWGVSRWMPGVSNILVLDDSRNMPAFQNAVERVLPEFLVANNVSSSFNNVNVAMNNIRDVSTLITGLSIGFSVTMLSLLVMLSVKLRRQEIGIYLALGERKINIIGQLMIEILIIVLVAVSLALLTNHFITSRISYNLVLREMEALEIGGRSLAIQIDRMFFWREANILDWFVPEAREVQDLIEVFDIAYNGVDILQIFAIIIALTVLVMSLSIIYVMRLSPKQMLTLGER